MQRSEETQGCQEWAQNHKNIIFCYTKIKEYLVCKWFKDPNRIQSINPRLLWWIDMIWLNDRLVYSEQEPKLLPLREKEALICLVSDTKRITHICLSLSASVSQLVCISLFNSSSACEQMASPLPSSPHSLLHVLPFKKKLMRKEAQRGSHTYRSQRCGSLSRRVRLASCRH